MNLIETQFLNNAIYLWILAFVITVVFLLAAVILRNLILRRSNLEDEDGRRAWNTLLIGIAIHTKGWFVIIFGLYLGTMFLALPARLHEVLELTAITLLLLQFGFWGTNLINYWIRRRIRKELEVNNTNATTFSGLGLVARIVLWSILTLMVLENVTGIQVNTLVASLGITGIAVALAVQNILGDLFASLSITLDRPFVIGDFIIIGEFSGTVEFIGLKSTRIRSLSGEQLIFSNSDLLNSRIRNFKRMERRRIVFDIDVIYQTAPEKAALVPNILREIIEAQENVTFDRAHFKALQDSALNFEVVYFVEKPDYLFFMDTQQAINLEIMRRFADHDIQFAYPTQLVYMQQQSSNARASVPDL
jgi:small-conductance mechanosensitive channel